MRKKHALRLLRKYKLIYPQMSLRRLSRVKNVLHGDISWMQQVKLVLFALYVSDSLPPEGVFIKELNLHVGGTLVVEMRNGEVVGAKMSGA